MTMHKEVQVDVAADRMEQMLGAATSLFNRYSFAGTTMEQVATRLGLVPGALYRHFQDKEDLIFRCYCRGVDIYRRELQSANEAGLDGLEQVRRFVRGCFRPGRPRMVMFSDIASLSKPRFSMVSKGRYRNVKMLEGMIEKGVQDGSIVPNDCFLTSIAIFSVLDWVPFWFTERSYYYTRQDVMETFDDLVAHGLYRRDLPPLKLPPPPDLSRTVAEREAMPKRQAKVDHLLRVAMDNFNKKGVIATSLEDIAKQAGVTRAAIYYHVKDKEELLYRCLRRGVLFDMNSAQFLDLNTNAAEVEITSRRVIFELHPTAMGPKIAYLNLRYLIPEHLNELSPDIERLIKGDEQLVARGIEQGIYRNLDSYLGGRYRAALCNWFPVWYQTCYKRTPQQIADNHSMLLLFGLKPRNLSKYTASQNN